jgi:hypothetical protein
MAVNAELRLINAVLDGADWSVVVSRGLDKRRFIDNPTEWRWLVDFRTKYGVTPSQDAVDDFEMTMRKVMKNYEFLRVTVTDPIDHLCSEVEDHLKEQGANALLGELISRAEKGKLADSVGIVDQLHEAITDMGISSKGLPVRSLAEFKMKPITWEWANRIARGKVTIIGGDGGASKGFLVSDLMARLTTGRSLPGEPESAWDAVKVLFICDEDGIEDTIAPRIAAAGGNRKLVDVIDNRTSDDYISFPTDFAKLRHTMQENGYGMVVIDSGTGYIGDHLNLNSDADMRKVLTPLGRIAEQFDIPILLIWHINKNQGVSAVFRLTGAQGIRNVVRCVLFVGRPPDVEDDAYRVVVPNKNNPGKLAPALAYRIVDETVAPERVGDNDSIHVGRLEWFPDPVDYTADDIIGQPKRDIGRPATARDEATAWLQEELEAGPTLVENIKKKHEEETINDGITFSWPTLERAARELGIVRTTKGRSSEWSLPT